MFRQKQLDFFAQLANARTHGRVVRRQNVDETLSDTAFFVEVGVGIHVTHVDMTTEAEAVVVLQLVFATGRTLVDGEEGFAADFLRDHHVHDQLTHSFGLVDGGAAHADEAGVHFHHFVADLVLAVELRRTRHVGNQIFQDEVRQVAEGGFITLGTNVRLGQNCILLVHKDSLSLHRKEPGAFTPSRI
ncbi:hypothetical protein D9M70_317260 [compost metagenome]